MVVQLHLQNCKSDKSAGFRVDERLAAGQSAVINITKFEMSLSGLINGFEKRLSCYRQQDEQADWPVAAAVLQQQKEFCSPKLCSIFCLNYRKRKH